jgi:DNA-binding transcriptional MerR regulator
MTGRSPARVGTRTPSRERGSPPPPEAEAAEEACGEPLLSIGAAAAQAGVTERALRYYQELGLLSPSGHTKGGMRRYSQADLGRVARIRELQVLLGLNLDEIAAVLRDEDRAAEIRAAYYEQTTGRAERERLLLESLGLATRLRATVESKRSALDAFLSDLDARIARITAALEQNRS